MKVFLEPDAWLSQSIHRVTRALKANAPDGVHFVGSRKQADLEILHLVGWGGVPEDLGVRPFAAIQYCLASTENPDPGAWWDRVWRRARVTWSYYDLAAEFGEDWLPDDEIPFYHAPLGVDGSTFRPNGNARSFAIGTSGYVAASECIDECNRAARAIGGSQFHLGPDLGLPGVTYENAITDEKLAKRWGSCRYVSGLRRVEGFELPAFEGLACGARPIVFDREHHRTWLGDSAVYARETAPDELAEELREILARDPIPVTDAERQAMLEVCSWPRIARGFWERALG